MSNAFWDITFLENSVRSWGAALLTAVLLTIFFSLTNRLLLHRFYNFAEKSSNQLDDYLSALLKRTNRWIIFVLSLFAGSLLLTFGDTVANWLGTIALIIFLVQVAIWGDSLIDVWLQRYQADNLETQAGEVTTMRAVSFVVRLLFYAVILLLALDNIPGVEVTSLIASLGIGGIAVALAVQNLLADLFASLSISIDKPFVLGDFIMIDDYRGTVENIGLKTTRLRSLTGEQLVFANNDLLNSRIRNYKRMEERRITFQVSVTYQTAAEKLARIPEMLETAVSNQEETRFDRAHFKAFGPSALNFELIYWVLNPDYNVHMDIQEAINLELVREFQQAEIEFAYPTRTLYLAGNNALHTNGRTPQQEKQPG